MIPDSNPSFVGDVAESLALAAALRAALEVRWLPDLCRAVLREASVVVPFQFGVVLRLEPERAEVVGIYPAPVAGIAPGLIWFALDAAEREVLRLGEPQIDGVLRVAGSDRSPLTRLPAFGLHSAVRVPLFAGGAVVGVLLVYAEAQCAFSALDGLRTQQYAGVIEGRLASASGDTAGAPEPLNVGASVIEAARAAEVSPAAALEPQAPEPSESSPTVESYSVRADVQRGEDPERLSALGELVSGVAHELNNPLTTILGYAQLLPSLTGDELRRATAVVEQEAQRAGRIVRNLLYFARQHRPRTAAVDINAVLSRVIEVRRYSLEASGVTIESTFGPIPTLLGDEYQLEQVFLNLVTNAQQALISGGTIHIASEQGGGVVRVSVTDTGPGIPEELVSRIFEPFFSTREVGEGSGLGLSVAYGIVQSHGGRLFAERALGGGARFVVELPIPRDSDLPGSFDAEPPLGRGERVLVVDDEQPVRELVSVILGASGYTVASAASGREALRVLEAGAFDLVLSDVRMPGIDGAGLYEALAARWPQLRRRVVLISGDAEPERFSALLRDGDVRFLEKPFTAAALLRIVRQVLDRPAE